MRNERPTGLVDYVPPYTGRFVDEVDVIEGEIISLPDQPGEDLEVINVGDAKDVVVLTGNAADGSTITMPTASQLRRTNLDKIPAGMTFNDEEMKIRLAMRRYLYTIQPDGSKLQQELPEKGWVDPHE